MNERILIVDDDPFVRKIIGSRLTKLGYEVATAENTSCAIHSCMEERPPDLMVLDLNLVEPESMDGIRDGFGLLAWMERFVPNATMPVIIYTGASSISPTHVLPKNVIGALKKQRDLNPLLEMIRQGLDHANAA